MKRILFLPLIIFATVCGAASLYQDNIYQDLFKDNIESGTVNVLFNMDVGKWGPKDQVSNNSVTNTSTGDRLNYAGTTFSSGNVAIDPNHGMQCMGAITNLMGAPNDLTDAAWTPSGSTVVVDASTWRAGAQYNGIRDYYNTGGDTEYYTFSTTISTTSEGAGSGYYIEHLYSATGDVDPISLTTTPTQFIRTVQGKTGGGNVGFGARDGATDSWENVTMTNNQATLSKYKLPDNFTGSPTATDNAKNILSGTETSFPYLYEALYGTDGSDAAAYFVIKWTPGFDTGECASSVNILSFDGSTSNVRYNDSAGTIEIYDGTNTASVSVSINADTPIWICFRYYVDTMAVGYKTTSYGVVSWGSSDDFVGNWGPGSNVVFCMSDDVQFIGSMTVTRITSFSSGSLESSGLAYYGGFLSTDFGSGTTVNGDTGRTYIYRPTSQRLRQDGFISQVKINVSAYDPGDYFKIKVFRQSGSSYIYKGESEQVVVSGTGLQTETLSSPVPCEPGDCVGIFLCDSTLVLNATSDTNASQPEIRYASGDITSDNNFTDGTLSDYALDIEASGSSPFFVITGDSIAEGSNEGYWASFWSGGPGGDPNAEIMNQVKASIDSDMVVFDNYQNHAEAGMNMAWVNSTGLPSALSANPVAVIVHCGVLDVSGAHTWQQVETELDGMIAQLSGSQHLFLDEILPWTGGTDAQALTIRTFNTNLRQWCGENGASLILCHDAMAQTRETTGALDDLLSVYNYDDTHLTQEGVLAMAYIWRQAIKNYYGY